VSRSTSLSAPLAPGATIGILGGGQLGRMLVLAASRLGLKCHVFSDETESCAFYVADADCVGVTKAVPWTFNRQWLDLLARSGTMLFVSLAPDALGSDERRDLKAALALAAAKHYSRWNFW
jgi:D-arabinose 1-dehydrogenase-like Zn-dependent alcohol dehydrogenase